MTRTIEKFAEEVGVALGEGPGSTTLSRQRARLGEGPQTVERSFLALRPALAFAAAALAVVCVAWWLSPRDDGVRVAVQGRGLDVGEAVAATVEADRPLEFSEGSRIVLRPKARARVTALTRERAAVKLEAGSMDAAIERETGIAWTIAAGPYRVHVVGTQFRVDWERQQQRFRVAVSEGKVRVTGGDLPAPGVTLVAGQHLERQLGDKAASRADGTGLTARAATEPAPSTANEAAEDTARAVATNDPAPEPEKDWKELARAGDHRAALQALNAAGTQGAVNRLPPQDLLLLGSTARAAGRPALAREAYLTIRQRFPGQSAARVAAFTLGRMAADGGGQAEAVRWFQTFLKESPSGDLAAGARARLMQIWVSGGNRAAAQGVAREYLRYHPNGPHAATARQLLEPTE